MADSIFFLKFFVSHPSPKYLPPLDSPGTLYFTQNPSALQSHVYPGIATVVPLLSSKIFLELSTSFTIMTQGLLTTEALPVPLKTSSERETPLTLVSQSLHHSPELLALRCPHILQHCIHTLAQAELWCGCWSMKAHVLRTTFKRRSWGLERQAVDQELTNGCGPRPLVESAPGCSTWAILRITRVLIFLG